jgi:hypothetical protein
MDQHIATIRAHADTLTDQDKIHRHNISVGLDVYDRLTRGEAVHPALADSAQAGLHFPGRAVDPATKDALWAVAAWIEAQPATGTAPATEKGTYWRDLCNNVYLDLGDSTVKHIAIVRSSYTLRGSGDVDARSEIERVYGRLSPTTDPWG